MATPLPDSCRFFYRIWNGCALIGTGCLLAASAMVIYPQAERFADLWFYHAYLPPPQEITIF
jgi:hypothetical protein